MALNMPHKSARAVQTLTAALEGNTVTLTIHDGHASDGYSTDYTRRPVRWVVYRRNGVLVRSERYAGRRLAGLAQELATWQSELLAAGAAVTVVNTP